MNPDKEEDNVSVEMGDKEEEKHESISRQPTPSTLFVGSVVAFYFIVSMSVVFLNKVVVGKAFNFPYPLVSTWIQLVVALIGLYALSEYKRKGGNVPFDIPPFELHKEALYRVLPLTVVYVGMLSFNNIVIKLVPVSMYQVARSQSLTFNIIMTYILLGKKTSPRAIAACVTIIIGYLMGISDTVEITATGVIFGLLSSFFVSLYSLNVEKVMPLVKGNQWTLLMYNTTLAIAILGPIAFIVEGNKEMFNPSVLLAPSFIAIMLFTSVMGFMINIAMFLQIKYTSGLTSIVSGTAKAAVQSVLGYFLFSETLTSSEMMSNLIVIVGSAAYSYIRFSERKPNTSSK